MVRPRRFRRVACDPRSTYYKPVGIPMRGLEEVVIMFDELEAMRLTEESGLSQIDASVKMNISQPTLNRLIANFNKKITDALINSKAIRLENADWIN